MTSERETSEQGLKVGKAIRAAPALGKWREGEKFGAIVKNRAEWVAADSGLPPSWPGLIWSSRQ
jgi:hypothetical protein